METAAQHRKEITKEARNFIDRGYDPSITLQCFYTSVSAFIRHKEAVHIVAGLIHGKAGCQSLKLLSFIVHILMFTIVQMYLLNLNFKSDLFYFEWC